MPCIRYMMHITYTICIKCICKYIIYIMYINNSSLYSAVEGLTFILVIVLITVISEDPGAEQRSLAVALSNPR